MDQQLYAPATDERFPTDWPRPKRILQKHPDTHPEVVSEWVNMGRFGVMTLRENEHLRLRLMSATAALDLAKDEHARQQKEIQRLRENMQIAARINRDLAEANVALRERLGEA